MLVSWDPLVLSITRFSTSAFQSLNRNVFLHSRFSLCVSEELQTTCWQAWHWHEETTSVFSLMENQQHWFNIGGVYFPCRPQCYFCTSCRHEFLSLLHYSWHSRCFLLSKLHTRHGRSSGSSLTLPEGLNGSIRFNPGLNESHLFAWIIRHQTCGRIDRRQDLSEYWWASLAFGLCPSCGGARVWVCWTQVIHHS